MATTKEMPPRKKEPSLKKVAAYCCVSTKTQEQLDSLIPQENCCESKIKASPDQRFAGVYSDISNGTTIFTNFPVYEEAYATKTSHLS